MYCCLRVVGRQGPAIIASHLPPRASWRDVDRGTAATNHGGSAGESVAGTYRYNWRPVPPRAMGITISVVAPGSVPIYSLKSDTNISGSIV